MQIRLDRPSLKSGFTILELMIVLTIIGIVASVAVPLFARNQLRAKSAEGKTNLAAIRIVEEALHSESGAFVAAAAEPALIPGTVATQFDQIGSEFAALGWNPEGQVFFSYSVTVSADGNGFTADAGADVDGDGIIQLWGYSQADGTGNLVAGGIGCDPTLLAPNELGYCVATPGIF